MMSERDLVKSIFETVLRGTEADIEARQNAVWGACQTLMADCLRGADEFTRERLLQRLGPSFGSRSTTFRNCWPLHRRGPGAQRNPEVPCGYCH